MVVFAWVGTLEVEEEADAPADDAGGGESEGEGACGPDLSSEILQSCEFARGVEFGGRQGLSGCGGFAFVQEVSLLFDLVACDEEHEAGGTCDATDEEQAECQGANPWWRRLRRWRWDAGCGGFGSACGRGLWGFELQEDGCLWGGVEGLDIRGFVVRRIDDDAVWSRAQLSGPLATLELLCEVVADDVDAGVWVWCEDGDRAVADVFFEFVQEQEGAVFAVCILEEFLAQVQAHQAQSSFTQVGCQGLVFGGLCSFAVAHHSVADAASEQDTLGFGGL